MATRDGSDVGGHTPRPSEPVRRHVPPQPAVPTPPPPQPTKQDK